MRSLLLSFLLLTPVIGQEIRPQEPPRLLEPTPVPLRDGEKLLHYSDSARLTEKIYILMDVSVSMKAWGRIEQAADTIIRVMEQQHENCEIQLVTFWGGSLHIYREDGKSWFELPSLEPHIERMKMWLRTLQAEDCSYTDPLSAFTYAILNAEREASILVVSDGQFHNFSHSSRQIRDMQREKLRSSGHMVPIFFYGIGFKNEFMLELVAQYGGWYIRYYEPTGPLPWLDYDDIYPW